MNRAESDVLRLQAIIDSTNLGTWEWNVQSGETVFNDNWAQIIGYTLDELTPTSIKTWETLAHPDDMKSSSELLECHFAGEQPYYDIECRMKHKDGHWVWVHDRGKVVTRTADGKPLMMFGTHADITERKLAEQALHDSEAKYRLQFQNMNSYNSMYEVVTDKDGKPYDFRFVMVNHAYEDYTSKKASELIGKTLLEVYPGTEQYWIDKMVEVVLTGLPSYFESFSRVMNTYTEINLYIPQKGQLAMTTANITARKQAEESLRKSDEKQNIMISNISDVIGIIGADGVMKYKSPNIEKWFGWKPQDLVGTDGWLTVHPADLERIQNVFYTILEKDKAVKTIEYRYKCKDGNYKWIELTAINLTNDPLISGVLLNYHDITERKQSQDMLRESEQKYSSLFNSMLEGFALHEIICDTDGKPVDYRFLDMNPAFEQLTSIKKSDAIGKTVLSILPTTEAIWIEKYGQVALTGESISFENYSNAVERHYQVVAFCPKKNQFAVFFTDITMRKQAEAKIREKDIQFRKLSANVPDLIFQFTRRPDGSYCVPIASEGIKNIFGCSPEDVLDDFTPIGRVIYPEDAERVISDIEYSAKHLAYFTCEFRVQIPGKPIQWIFSRSVPEKLPDGSITWFGFNANITERKQAEEALRESEDKFSKAFETSPYAITITRVADGSFVNVNDAFTSISEYLREETLADSSIGLKLWVHEEDRNRVVAELRAGRAVTGKEFLFRTKSGKIITGLFAAQIIELAIGPCILSSINDITERKRAEDQLKKTNQRLDTLLSSLYAGVIATSEDGEVEQINQAFCDLFNLTETPAGLRGLSSVKMLKKITGSYYDPTETITRIQEIVKKGKPVKGEEINMRDGRFCLVDFIPIIDNDGNRSGRIWHHQDITERKHAEDAIAAEKERLAVTLRSIGDGVITTDIQGNVVIMNKVAEELCGWKQDEAQGKPLTSVFNIINQSTREQYENPVVKVLSTGQIIELANHTLLISRDGTERIIADSGAPIKDKDSKTIGVVLVFRDMTEKHKLLDNMQRIDKLDSLGVLAGGIAHDFNNLLCGIFGYIEMARDRTTTDITVSKYLDKALTAFERAKDLTQQLLTFSKGGAPKRKTGQIGKLVKENAAFVLSGANVSCAYHIAPDLWLADYDENQIGQVIDNIVLNAQQAMPVGGTIVILVNNLSLKDKEVLTLKAGNYIKISITDTGVGIPQDLLKRIFDPFFTTKQKGNGLGLATCYSIVQKHDGFIDVESMPGKGSTFHIYLPATHKGTVQDVSQTVTQHKGKGSILVMDDEYFMREIVGNMLVDMGYSLIEAENGEEALRLCAEAKKQGNLISGALFDLTIPNGMGGKEAIVILHKDFPDMPVFASSGFSEDPTMARPTEFGFTDSIRKPFKKNELAEMLNKHLKMQK